MWWAGQLSGYWLEGLLSAVLDLKSCGQLLILGEVGRVQQRKPHGAAMGAAFLKVSPLLSLRRRH